MTVRNVRLAVIGVVVLVFVAVGAVIAFRNAGGGGVTRNVTLNVTAARMTPDRISARQGDTLNLTVVNDHDAEVHLHGYDVHFEGGAGQPVTKSIKLDKTGSFEIELEASSTHLGELDVT
jgi:FtsP/CotA-like multicopper oxidase with cupredoxin domain